MFDSNKLERFEKSLELHNRSPQLAEFWNEISEDLKDWDGFIDNLQWDNFTTTINARKKLELHNKIFILLVKAHQLLADIKKLQNIRRYGHKNTAKS